MRRLAASSALLTRTAMNIIFNGTATDHRIPSPLADTGPVDERRLVTIRLAVWRAGVRGTVCREDIGLDLSRHNERAYTAVE